MGERMDQMPVFVKITGAHEIKILIDSLMQKVDEARDTLDLISSLADKEALKVSEWELNLDTMNEKIDSVKNILLEPEMI